MPACLPASLGYLNPLVVDDLCAFGDAARGGYILPRSRVDDLDAVVSFGVEYSWSLEDHLAKTRPQMPIHAYDHTIGERVFTSRLRWEVLRLARFKSTFAAVAGWHRLRRDYRRVFSGPRVHFRERVYNRIENPNDATIDKVFSRLRESRQVFLKMDIEGGEYRLIRDILKYADRIDLMAIEFHDTDFHREVFERNAKAILAAFEIVHLHGVNFGHVAEDGLPDALEATFVNRRYITDGPRRNRLPIAGLDAPSDPAQPDVPLEFC